MHAHQNTSSRFNEHRSGTRERERERESKKKEKRGGKAGGGEEDARSATTQFTMARHGTIYSPEAATFFRISTTTSGTMIASPSTRTHTHTHTHKYTHARETFFQGVVSLYRGTNEVPAPSAGRKKDNGRKEWGSIS